MDWLKKLIASILAMFGISAALSANKSSEVKKLKKVIKDNKKQEKQIVSTIKEMEKSKKGGKRTISTLKRQLKSVQTDTKKMETAFDKDDVDEAVDFLKKFAGS
jgi:predicted  nucleic acid-binding Zn-ribbon protein